MFDDIGVGITFILNNYDEVDNKIRTLQERLHLLSKVKLGDTFSETNKQAASLMGKLEQLESSINGMANGAATLNSNLNGIKNVETSTSKMSKSAKSFSDDLHAAVSGAKKLAFSLLTVRGIWFAIRKAMTTYLSQNDELKSKMDGLYYGVGSMFAPLLEVLVNGLITIISYIDVLVKALGFAGINMKNYGKATSSAAKETQKLLKIDEINNLNESSGGSGSSFDVSKMFDDVVLSDKIKKFATNLGITIKDVFFTWGDNQNGETILEKASTLLMGVLGYTVGGLPGLAIGVGLGLIVNSVLFDHNGCLNPTELFGSMALITGTLALFGLSVAGGYGAVAGAALGMIFTVSIIASELLNMDEASKEIVSKITQTLTAIAGIGVIAGLAAGSLPVFIISAAALLSFGITNAVVNTDVNGSTMEDMVKQAILSKLMKDGYTYEQALEKAEFELMDVNIKDASINDVKTIFEALGKELPLEVEKGITSGDTSINEVLANAIISSGQTIYENEDIRTTFGLVGQEMANSTTDGMKQGFEDNVDDVSEGMTNATSGLSGIYEQLEKDSSVTGTSMITAMTSGVVDNKGKILKAWEDIKVTILGNWQELESGIKNSCNNIVSTIEGMLNSIISGFNSFSNNINNLSYEQKNLMGIGFALASIESVSLPRLATGTNYVPNDMVAMIHQGEAVVPKEFNPSTFYGTNTAEELNLLASINEQLVELNRKDYNIELDGESVVKKIDNRINELNFRNGNKVFAIQR